LHLVDHHEAVVLHETSRIVPCSAQSGRIVQQTDQSVRVLLGGDPGQGALSCLPGEPFGWESVALERLLRSGTHLPLHIDNGAKTMGQAELWFGAGRGARHAIVCLIGSGMGASIITSRNACRGFTASAEWGHTTVAVGGRACRCGSRGCLEAYIGAEAILDRYGHSLPGDDEESALAALIDMASTSAAAEQVLGSPRSVRLPASIR
jgi:predicted NBD/HSP70 family sugar kinase